MPQPAAIEGCYAGAGCAVQVFLRRLGLGLDTALNRASQVPGPSRQHVFGMLLVCGTPFYGYHAHEKVWVKIMM